MKEIFAAVFLFFGALFFLMSALGILKFPDVLTRMHAAAKASSLGVGFALLGVLFHFPDGSVIVKALFIILFTFLTAPVSAQILGRVGYSRGEALWSQTVLDEIKTPPKES